MIRPIAMTAVLAIFLSLTMVSAESTVPAWLFAQTADSILSEDGVLTVVGDRDVFAFTDRPCISRRRNSRRCEPKAALDLPQTRPMPWSPGWTAVTSLNAKWS